MPILWIKMFTGEEARSKDLTANSTKLGVVSEVFIKINGVVSRITITVPLQFWGSWIVSWNICTLLGLVLLAHDRPTYKCRSSRAASSWWSRSRCKSSRTPWCLVLQGLNDELLGRGDDGEQLAVGQLESSVCWWTPCTRSFFYKKPSYKKVRLKKSEN